jgi:hypothetical protein
LFQSENCSSEKQSELSAQIICLNDELSTLKSRFAETSRDKESLELELSTLKSNFEQISAENVELRKNVETARDQVDAANKVFLFKKNLFSGKWVGPILGEKNVFSVCV